MATPMLRAMRLRFPDAKITYLMRRWLKPIYAGMPWADRLLTYRSGAARGGDGSFRLGRLLKTGRFDLAVLLPNSFKSALICKLAKIPRIVGYDRDGRGLLLTDKLMPLRQHGGFVPAPIVHYYLALARYLGSQERDTSLQLFVTEAERVEATDVFVRAGLDSTLDRPARAGKPPLVILNPGANYGAAKIWKPEYFAAVSDRLVDELGATVIISTAPKERRIVEEIAGYTRRPFIDTGKLGPSLGAVKEIIRRADLMITNDTGPRHIAAALDVPVVTVFGPTHQEWTEIDFPFERKVAVKVFCGPCQRKTCPLDHRCMTRVTPEMVWGNAMDVLESRRNSERRLPIVG
jgi:heptosyltransferase-2